jgi:hypothetical protein
LLYFSYDESDYNGAPRGVDPLVDLGGVGKPGDGLAIGGYRNKMVLV